MKDPDLEFKEPEFFNTAKERDAWMDRNKPIVKYSRKEGDFVLAAKPKNVDKHEFHEFNRIVLI